MIDEAGLTSLYNVGSPWVLYKRRAVGEALPRAIAMTPFPYTAHSRANPIILILPIARGGGPGLVLLSIKEVLK